MLPDNLQSSRLVVLPTLISFQSEGTVAEELQTSFIKSDQVALQGRTARTRAE